MIDSASSAYLYGKGIFTTIAIVDGAPLLWEKHWRRLTANAAKLDIDISEFSESEILEALALEIEKKEVTAGRARVTFSDESLSEIWSDSCERKTSLSIITAKSREIPDNFKLTVSPNRVNRTSPLVGIKSCNYLEHLVSLDEAKRRGFHEAIRLNECGEVASASMANLFWTKDGKLFTPSLRTGCLAGTTREYILENLECEEVEVGIDEINRADAIFLTSAGIGILAVADFEKRKMDRIDHAIESLILRKD
ncbi:MAG: hypothetical protein DMF62_11875 [Acidobacteria bacterium]|nr:MAG: hypothetical protein DMF62_11875 [Acidobacteriota bacterium]